MILQVTWDWPESLVGIAVTLTLALAIHVLLRRAISLVTKHALRRVEKHQRERPGLLVRAVGLTHERNHQRTATIGSVLGSATAVVVWAIALLTVLSILGLPLGPVLASAGIGGVALGFGAQSLVRDYISGLMMLAEDQYGVGDLIDTGDVVGTVEEVTLRVTRLRDASGVIWYIRNGEIVKLGNQSQGWSTASVELPIAPDEDPAGAISVLTQAMQELPENHKVAEKLLETPNVVGVESITGNAMTIRILCKTSPNQHWGVQREIRERGQQALQAAGIRGPRAAPTTLGPTT